MTDPLFLRASSLPLVFQCPGAARAPEIRISEAAEPATVGTAVHEALRSLPTRGVLDWEAIQEIADKHGVSADEVRLLCGLANKLWPELHDSFEGALTEVGLSHEIMPGVVLSGHVDLISVSEQRRVARAADWKTGRKDADYSHQMRAYGALVLLDDPSLEECTVTVVWIRDGEIENYTVTRETARLWLRELVERVVHWDGVYTAGAHCVHCHRAHECPAANALARRDVAAMNDAGLAERVGNELASMTADEIARLLEKADSVAVYCERVREQIKGYVARNGEVVSPGIRLSIETQERRELDPLKAWSVLESFGFSDEDFAEAMKLGVSQVEKIVAKKAGRGKGAAAVRDLKEKLEAAGAVSRNEIGKLTVKRST